MVVSAVGLRPARRTDVAALTELDHACFGNPWSLEIWGQEVARDLASVMIATSLDPLVGVVGSSCVWLVADEAHLLRIATRPTYRGRGVGRDLLEGAIVSARAAGCTSMVLEVARRNRSAIRLYQRSRFTVVGERKGYYATPPDDALLMRLPLDDA